MSDVGVRLHLLEASLQDRLRMFQHTQQQADEQAQLMKQQVDMTLEMIAKASEQLEETMKMLSDTEDDLQALKTAHETLRKILKKQVDEAKKKQDELDAFGSQLEQAASESARLVCIDHCVPHREFGSSLRMCAPIQAAARVPSSVLHDPERQARPEAADSSDQGATGQAQAASAGILSRAGGFVSQTSTVRALVRCSSRALFCSHLMHLDSSLF
jgi:conjugal transfer/entry exclusion protein